MEPKSNNEYSTGTELPQLEQTSGQVYGHEQTAAAPETRSQQPPPTTSGPTAGGTVVSVPITPISDTNSDAAVAGTNPLTATLTADDADLIEKEWVLKAKAIVMQTKNDPRAQNIQMSGIKADYLKKRYNKDLKVSET